MTGLLVNCFNADLSAPLIQNVKTFQTNESKTELLHLIQLNLKLVVFIFSVRGVMFITPQLGRQNLVHELGCRPTTVHELGCRPTI